MIMYLYMYIYIYIYFISYYTVLNIIPLRGTKVFQGQDAPRSAGNLLTRELWKMWKMTHENRGFYML